MGEKWKNILVLGGLVITLALFNLSVWNKERILEDGEQVLLKMAPVDPRMPFQGDYMKLEYEAAAGVSLDSIPRKGYCIVKPNGSGWHERIRFQRELNPLFPGECPIAYTTDRYNVYIGSSTYFFQEGKAHVYDSASYAGMKVDHKGNSVLVGLYDKNRQLVK